MATNAPYYQMRGSQFANPTNPSFPPDHVVDANYDPSAPPNGTHLHAHTQPAHNIYSDHLQESTKNIQSPVVPSLEVDNHHFVELLEAATTAAAGQASMAESTPALAGDGMGDASGKRKRGSSSPSPDSPEPVDAASAPKRARVDPALPGRESEAQDRSESGSVPPSSESLLNDARAAGVHSAAALFRRTSEKTSRKYTRPPMSKLFISLQLTPENFLRLQAEAKSYMLNPAYPDRQSCVGNRGKGDTDMVKLRLFNCVRDFLNDGIGEQYFGEGAKKPADIDNLEAAKALGQEKVSSEEQLLWPRDGNKIISLVTPLLRRMVTNERQRMYAIETRRGGSKKKEATPTADDTPGMSDSANPTQQLQQLQTAFESPRSVSLAPAQVRSQHLYTPSPSSPTPHTPHPVERDATMTTHYAESKSAIELFPGEKLMLPTEPTVDPFLSKINIFVTKNGHLLRTEKRFTNLPSAPLFHMTWQEVNIRVLELVRETMLLYPQLQEELNQSAGMGPETLRGLAVAAMQNQSPSHEVTPASDADANTETAARIDTLILPTNTAARAASELSLLGSSFGKSPQSQQGVMAPSAALPSESLPEYKVGTQTSKGWLDVTCEEEWTGVKGDLARAVWADRICSVVVTLLT